MERVNSEVDGEDLLLTWLLAYDDALAAGASSGEAFAVSSGWAFEATAPDQLHEYGHVLDLLEQAWPRSHRREIQRDSAGAEAAVQIGRFQIQRELGRGGFGVVYLAHDPKLRRLVALKMPKPELLLTSALRQRFLREAQATASLNHPNIAPVFETGEIGSVCYLVSPFCSGGTLAEYLRNQDEAFPVRQAARLVLRMAEAIAYAHTRGVLHRDIKPANVLLDLGDVSASSAPEDLPYVPRLTDFGLARFFKEEEDSASICSEGCAQASLATGSGMLLGTPRYMAPEQIDGNRAPVGPATDVYGLGVLFYELLSGAPPFSGGSRLDALRRVLTEEPAPLRRVRQDVPPDLEAICLKCLEKQPDRRYAMADQLCADLRRFLKGEATVARPLTVVQRTTRCVRRHPALATLVGSAAVAALALIAILTVHSARLEQYTTALQESLTRESRQTRYAHQQRRVAEQRELVAREHAYVSDTWNAWRLWNEDKGHRICSLLQRSRPDAEQKDLRGFEWRYLWSLGCNLSDLQGHIGTVEGICFSPDGRMCASWSGDSTFRSVRLWDVARRSERAVLDTLGRPEAAVFSAAGSHLVTLDSDGRLSTWDTQTGRQIESFVDPELIAIPEQWAPLQEAQSPPNLYRGSTIAFSRDGSILAYEVHIRDGEAVRAALHLRDLQTKEVRTLLGPAANGALGLTFSHDDQRLAAAIHLPQQGYELRVLDTGTGRISARFGVGFPIACGLEFSPDGRRLAVGSRIGPGSVHVLDFVTKQYETVEVGGDNASVCLAFSPDGKLLTLGRCDHPGSPIADVFEVRNVESGFSVATIPTSGERIRSVRFSPDGEIVACGGEDGLLRLYRMSQTEAVQRLAAHDKEAWSVNFSPDGSLMASGSDDHTVRIWDTASGELRTTLEGHLSLVAAATFSPDGRTLASSSFDGAIKLWDTDSLSERRTLTGHEGAIRDLAFSHSGALLASVGDDRTVKLWDVDSGTERTTLPADTDKLRTVVFQPGTDHLITAGNSGFIRVWDSQRGVLLQESQDANEVHSLSVSADGTLLAAGSKSGAIRLYRLPDLQVIRVLSGPANSARSVAFSADARTLAAGGEDAAVTLWHVATGRELLVLPGVTAQVNQVAFSPDDQILAAATHDGSLILWHAPAED